MQVFISALDEKVNAKFVIFASNILATTTDINCDNSIPTTSPTINEMIPTNKVSLK